MKVDSGAQILEVPAGATDRSAPPHKFPACPSGHLGELARSPEFVEAGKTAVELCTVSLAGPAGLVVEQQHIGNRYFFELAFSAARLVLVCETG